MREQFVAHYYLHSRLICKGKCALRDIQNWKNLNKMVIYCNGMNNSSTKWVELFALSYYKCICRVAE